MKTLKYKTFNTGLPKTPLSTLNEYISPLIYNSLKNIKLIESDEISKKGEPILGFCVSGGTENAFLEYALKNPESPAVILVHSRANSFAAGCEISARLNEEFKRGNRAPSIFCSVEDTNRLNSILQAASVSSDFILNSPKIGLIGDPSNWLIGSGYFAENLPKIFGIQNEKISINEFITLSKKYENVYLSLKELISKYKLNALTIRCFDLLQSLQKTSCLELSRLNDEDFVAACEGDIPSTVTMMIMQKMTNLPVFMANPTGIKDNIATFAHCTIPKRLCIDSKIMTHFESGIGTAVSGKVIEGKWTVARFGVEGNIMTDTIEVSNPKTFSNHQCRTQIVTKISKKFAKKLRKGEVLGNHFLFVPGDIKNSLKIFSNIFKKWNPIKK